MEEEFIPYEQALELKKLGYDGPCLNRFYTKPKSKMFSLDEKGRHYPIKNTSNKLYTLGEHFVLNEDNVIITPLYQQVFKWFRKEHKLVACVRTNFNVDFYYEIYIDHMNVMMSRHYKTYEEVELECLKKLIEIIKPK